jgi:hypothetical protein
MQSDYLTKLDEFLNARILNSDTAGSVRGWWLRKIEIKRYLATLPPDEVDGAAGGFLRQLEARRRSAA